MKTFLIRGSGRLIREISHDSNGALDEERFSAGRIFPEYGHFVNTWSRRGDIDDCFFSKGEVCQCDRVPVHVDNEAPEFFDRRTMVKNDPDGNFLASVHLFRNVEVHSVFRGSGVHRWKARYSRQKKVPGQVYDSRKALAS